MIPAIFLVLASLVSINAEPPVYPQVRFQPLKNVLVLPTNEQLKAVTENATKHEVAKPKDAIAEEDAKPVTMDELKSVEGSVTGSYHVLLENGRLQRVDYTSAPRLPVKEQVQAEPEIRSWYYTQVPNDILQRYYAEYYAQQQNAEIRKPGSTNQASNSNSQGFSQSTNNGANQASNHNVQVFHQGKKGALIVGNFDGAASQQSFQTTQFAQAPQNTFQNAGRFPNAAGPNQNAGSSVHSSANSFQNTVSSQQRVGSRDEVETFEPVQRRTEQRDQQGFPPSSVVATIYYSDVNPITGPVYTFEQTPLVRVLRQA